MGRNMAAVAVWLAGSALPLTFLALTISAILAGNTEAVEKYIVMTGLFTFLMSPFIPLGFFVKS